MKLSRLFAGVAVSAACVSAAQATTVLHFTATDGSGVTATLVAATSGSDNGFGARDITGLTGSVSGGVAPGAITSFTPTPGLTHAVYSADGRWILDNWVYASATHVPENIYAHGYVDNNGPLFSVGANEYNLFWNSNGPGGYELEVFNPHAGAYTGNYFGNAALPEPASWALKLMGVGGLGVTLRSRRRAAVAA